MANNKSNMHQFSPSLLTDFSDADKMANPGDVKERIIELEKIFGGHGINGQFIKVDIGPRISKFYFKANLIDDIARTDQQREQLEIAVREKLKLSTSLNSKQSGVRIVTEPSKGGLFIELPNVEQARVCLRDLLTNPEFDSYATSHELAFAIGMDEIGEPIYSNIDSSNLLIAGDRLGVTAALHDIVTSLIYQLGPNDLHFVIIDPDHYLAPFTNLPRILNPMTPEWDATSLTKTLKQIYSGINHRRTKQEQTDAKFSQLVTILASTDTIYAHCRDNDTKVEVDKYLATIIGQGPKVGVHAIIADNHFPSNGYILSHIDVALSSFSTRMVFHMAYHPQPQFIPYTDAAQLLDIGDGVVITPDHIAPQRFQVAEIGGEDTCRRVATATYRQ